MIRTLTAPRPTLVVMGLIGSLVGCLSLVAASAAGAAGSTTIYVARSGSDSASGSSSAPLRTISAAISRTPSNGTIIVRSGSYHESLTLSGRSNVTIKAGTGSSVYLDGSRTVTNWKKSGDNWVASGWTARFDSSPTFTAGAADSGAPNWQMINPAHPMAAHPDQVWIDGVAQKQVASLAKVRPGSFYVNYGTSQLVVGSKPTGHAVRASDLSKAISIRDQGAIISGINVRRYAPSVPTMGAVTAERPDITLKNLGITDNATSGLQIGGSRVHLSHVRLSRNGMMGLRANHADGLVLQHVTVRSNNRERFNPAPSAGGAKIVRTHTVTVQDSTFSNNFGTGLWFDESVYNMRVFGSRMSNNTDNGLALEISGTAKLANNVVSGNGADGMKINDTDKVDIWNNTLIGNGRTMDIAQDKRDVNIGKSYRNRSLPLTLRSQSVTLRNNIFAAPTAAGARDCLVGVEDHSHRFTASQLKISADGNIYQRPTHIRPQWLVVWSRGAGNPARYSTIKGVRSATGQEHRGRLLTKTAALTSSQTPTAAVNRLVASTAYAAPAWLATAAHVPTGSKHLGAWLR